MALMAEGKDAEGIRRTVRVFVVVTQCDGRSRARHKDVLGLRT